MDRKFISRWRLIPFCLSIALVLPASLQAWGWDGHKIIALMASRHLTPAAKEHVADLLGGDPSEEMVAVATWADKVRRDSTYHYTAPYHYVNMPVDAKAYVPERDCPDQACVVGAIEHYEDVLSNPDIPGDKQIEALKFLIHFVADIHQPMHASLEADLGGNTIPVVLNGDSTNLHALWDYGMMSTRHLSVEAYADRLDPKISKWDREKWSRSGPATWAFDSFKLAMTYGYPIPKDHNITPDYVKQGLAILDVQMEKASVRLADVLNSIFSY